MNDLDFLAFANLFKEASLKCFGYPLKDPFTETESKLFYNQVFDQTGLTIGWKSLKNYSLFVVGGPLGKEVNPSVATLDTLARYVLNAPYTMEIERKKKEGHYPYWFRYKEKLLRSMEAGQTAGVAGDAVAAPGPVGARKDIPDAGNAESVNWSIRRKTRTRTVVVPGMAVIVLAILAVYISQRNGPGQFTEDFHAVREDTLTGRGWFVKAKDSGYWERRGEFPGCLTLFTLKGDNWPDPVHAPVIRNLLLRKIPCDCFTVELHLEDFIPRQNWQQAGILLMEDTSFAGKSIRITIAYNDYNGGYPRSRSILIQAITSLGRNFGKPEEIAHIPLYNVDSLDNSPVIAKNLDNSALRIEKQGNKFRFLYANGSMENTPFKEMATHEFPMNPRYVGLFALKGFVENADDMPVRFKFFSLHCDRCTP
jgi:hypothetical protein